MDNILVILDVRDQIYLIINIDMVSNLCSVYVCNFYYKIFVLVILILICNIFFNVM